MLPLRGFKQTFGYKAIIDRLAENPGIAAGDFDNLFSASSGNETIRVTGFLQLFSDSNGIFAAEIEIEKRAGQVVTLENTECSTQIVRKEAAIAAAFDGVASIHCDEWIVFDHEHYFFHVLSHINSMD